MSDNPFSLWVYLSQSPLLWLTVTLLTYAVADAVSRKLGGYDRIAGLDDAQLEELRELYLEHAAIHVPDLAGRKLVDKQPFAMMEAPLIHRLFPNAKIMFAQRHPCDVVLSCFITRFEPHTALANFTTLEGTARVYDEMCRFWAQCRTILPLIVHRVRYERLVEDAELANGEGNPVAIEASLTPTRRRG